jgi:hypothetical protein
MTPAPLPKRSWNRLRVGLTAAVVMSAAVALLVWVSRPRWHTAISPVIPDYGVALSVEYPDAWEQIDVGGASKPWWVDSNTTTDMFQRLPPHGLLRWLRQHLLGQVFSRNELDAFHVSLRAREKDIDPYLQGLEKLERETGYQNHPHRFHHPLGPALELKNYASGTKPSFSGVPTRIAMIFCKDPVRHHKVDIEVLAYGEEGLPDWPEFEEVVRRVRLVPGK